jgi:hypothetical protein
MFKTLSVAALIVATATSSFAGSLNTAADPVVINNDPIIESTGNGLSVPLLIGGVVAAAAVAALVSNNNDDEAPATTTPTE